MPRHHLGFHSLYGCQFNQVAMPVERWLALLGWQSTALHLGPFGCRIDESALERRLRLALVSN